MATTRLARLRCLTCDNVEDAPPALFRCGRCGAALLVDDEPRMVRLESDQPRGVWRFAETLPSVSESARVSLGEGSTPLLPVGRASMSSRDSSPAADGNGRLWVKNEIVSPTGSYKDRFSAVNVSVARELGYRGITLASTGNAGLSAAAYGTRAGLEVRVYCPPESPPLIVEAIRATGARITTCDPGRSREAVAADLRSGFFPGSRAVPADNGTPFGCLAYKTISYEIVERLGHAPSEVYVPVGGGDGIYGIYLGFVDLQRAGLVDAIPRLVGMRTRSLAALSIARDEVGEHAVGAVARSGGEFRSVDHEQIVGAASALARMGVSAEPASAVSYAGMAASAQSADAGDVVCVVTGSGLKWPVAVSEGS